MPSATRSGERATAEWSPGVSTSRSGNAATGRRRSTTIARGNPAAPGRGRNATSGRGERSPPAANEQVTLASLATLMREIQTAQVTTTVEQRVKIAAAEEGVSTAEKGATDMCQQFQNELADYRARDGDDHNKPVTPVRRVEEKTHFGAWRDLSVRRVWITTGETPVVYGLKRSEMQALLTDIALASDETTLQLSTNAGFRVAAYMAEGDNSRLAANMFLLEQMEIMVEAMLAVMGNGVTSENGVDRVRILDDGHREGLTSLRVHCRKHWGKACLPENKVLLSMLIDGDLKEYSQHLFAAAVSAAKQGPPAVENMPPVVKPTWPALSSYVQGRGLMAARAPPAAAAGSARGEKRSRSASSRQGPRGECHTWRKHGFCRFGANCIFDQSASEKHRPDSNLGGGGGRGGASSRVNEGSGGTP